MVTEAKKAAKAKYDAKTAKYISLKLNKNTDAELISRLEKDTNIQSYIKRLIREDIKKAGE